MNDKEKLRLITDCLNERAKGYMSDRLALTIVSVIIKTEQPNDEDLEWAKQAIARYEEHKGTPQQPH